MNYRRIFVCLFLVAFTVAGLATGGHCHSDAQVTEDACYVETDAECKGTSGYKHDPSEANGPCDYPGQACSSRVDCATSWAEGWAQAYKWQYWRVAGNNDTSWAVEGWADSRSGAPDSAFITVFDTAQMRSLTSNTAELLWFGEIKGTRGTRAEAVVKVFQHDDPDDLAFTNSLIFTWGGGKPEIAGLPQSDINKTLSDDSLVTVNFNFTDTVTFDGTYESTGLRLVTDTYARNTPVPSLTPYGMLVLLVLLILSGIYVIRQRRRGVVR